MQKVKIGADLNNVVNVYVGLRLGRVHKDPEEYKRRVHSAERSMPQDMEHNSDGGCSVFARGRVLRCRERCSGRDGSSIDVRQTSIPTAALAEESATAVAWGNSDILMLHFYGFNSACSQERSSCGELLAQ